MKKEENVQNIHLYPKKGIVYIHTRNGTKIISIKQLLKDRILNKFEIGFIQNKKLYYKNRENKVKSVKIPEDIKLFIIFKDKKVYPFGIKDNKIITFINMPNLLNNQPFRYVCLNNYIPKSIKDAVDKFVTMPFVGEVSFDNIEVDINEFLNWLAE